MENIAAALEKLFAATGLRARVEPDGAKPTDDTQRTYFTVSSGGEHVLFSIDGTGEGARITAALAREYLTGAMGKSAVDPVRAFLCGGELPPGVRVGKADHYVFAIYGAARHRQALEYIAAMATVKDMYADMGVGRKKTVKVSVSSGNKPVFSSSNTCIATVNEHGVVTANDVGKAYIYAAEDGVKTRMRVIVK